MSHIWGIMLASVCLYLCSMGVHSNSVPVLVATVEDKFNCVTLWMTLHRVRRAVSPLGLPLCH